MVFNTMNERNDTICTDTISKVSDDDSEMNVSFNIRYLPVYY